MKGSRLYLLLMFAFLVIVFLVGYLEPHQFVWEPTYDKNDKEPFGSYVFDDVLSSSLDKYSVVNKTFYQLYQEDSILSSRAFLLTEQSIDFNKTDIEYLYKLIHLGNKIMICTDDYPYQLEDTLHFYISYERYTSFFEKNMLKNSVRDSIFFGTDPLNPECIFEVFPQVHPVSLNFRGGMEEAGDVEEVGEMGEVEEAGTVFHANCDSVRILVWDNKNIPLALHAYIGKGELFLVTTPLMFTNFGILDGMNASYVFRLLSFLKDKPLIRIEAYGKHGDKPHTPLRYILSETPLRWGTYSILLLLLLFMFFTAKRRQRIIPVINTPPNRTFGFMQLISNLYYQKHDNVEILKMKYMYFCAEIKNQIGVELYERVPDESDYERLVEKTGIEKDLIYLLLQNIRLAIYREEVYDLQLQQYIDGLNVILKGLKGEKGVEGIKG